MKSRIIINDKNVDDATALEAVLSVVKEGKISNEGKQYCYATRLDKIIVYANLAKTGTHVFDLWREK